MKKIFAFLKKELKGISFCLLILLIVFVNVIRVNADYMDEETEGNKKEQQLVKKIEIIHKIFPNQTDEEALFATLVHRGNITDYIEESYDESFNEKSYEDNFEQMKADINNVIDNAGQSLVTLVDLVSSAFECLLDGASGDSSDDYNEDCIMDKLIEKYSGRITDVSDSSLQSAIKKPQAVDLLTAATIVMLDSSSWTGNYSDDNYKKALAGEGLVGNMFDKNDFFQNMGSIAMNNVFCTIGGAVDIGLSWFNPGFTFDDGGNFIIQENAMAYKLSRYYTMSNICKLGFIGGTYEHVKNPDLSTDKGKEQYQKKKDVVAQEIINLAIHFRGEDNYCVYYGTTGNYSNWKQYDSQWSSESVGSQTVKDIGCTTTSIAIQIARSGTKITNIPSPYTEFNPGALAKSLSQNDGYSGDRISWSGYGDIAPNVRFKDTVSFYSSDEKTIADKMLEVLETPVEGQYQPFILLQMRHNGGEHWVAVQGVENNQVVINDPGRDGTNLSSNYSGEVWQVENYKVMYATDVPFGSEYSSGSSISGGNTYDDACNSATSGDIVIPEEFGNGIYTYTTYNGRNWIYNQKKVYDLWASSGAEWDDGIAVIDGRYLIACTETFGQVGDKVDFFLGDGTRIPCIIADIKSSSDAGYNKWGHSNGQSVLEFEVSVEAAKHYGDNVGNNGWHMEWANKRVASATNLGENVIGL